MRAIFKREFAAYMHSMTGWLFMAVTICLFAMYASVYNMSYGSPYVAYALDSILILFFITVPVLSMRVMAEERKQKTDQLLLTSPVSVGKIVLGKYLAMAAVFAIPSVLFCILRHGSHSGVICGFACVYLIRAYGYRCGNVYFKPYGKSGNSGCYLIPCAFRDIYDAGYREPYIKHGKYCDTVFGGV